MTAAHHPHVVIVGAGFAGQHAARALRNSPVRVTLIDRNNFQTFQPLLHQVATASLNVADIAFPVRGVTRHYGNCRFRQGVVTSLDLDARAVHLEGDAQAIDYDYLVVSGGARATYFGVPGADVHAFSLYSLEDATRIRNHVLRCIEIADAHPERIDDGVLTFVVVGAGPTGVEMAGGLYDVCVGIVRKDFPRLRDHRVQVVLVEARDAVLPQFHPKSQAYALRALRARGVDVRFGATVAAVDEDGLVLLGGARIPTSTVIWAAGVETGPLAAMLDVERSAGGRVAVDPDLSLSQHPEVFVAGDMANAVASDGRSEPQVAQVAIQSGTHVARQILLRIAQQPPQRFAYRNRGAMATIGRHAAVAELPSGARVTGTLGWLSWLLVHLFFVRDTRTRLSVLVNWAWGDLTRERGPRLILGADDTPSRSREEAVA